MLEAYLFIDPLCQECIQAESTVLKLAANVNREFSFQFIPMLNMKIIRDRYRRIGKQLTNETLNFKLEYGTVLDYKAALFQGRKCGRKFLIALQDQLIEKCQTYNSKIAIKVAKEAGLDIEMFEEDRRSPLAINAFKADQKLAHEMNIDAPASAVIFDCSSFESGIMMDHVDYDELMQICNRGVEKSNNLKTGNPIPKLRLI